MEQLKFTNGNMNIEVIALIGKNAFLKRLNDSSFIVVNGLNIKENNNCDWDFAYGYFERYDDAYECFNNKVIKEFQKYKETAEV